jgi:N-acetylglucosamine kinase-like BadF-type ATPase
MYIFADSGSTKTNWIITDRRGEVISGFDSIGLNPYFVSKEKILSTLADRFPDSQNPLLIEKVYFYGSGCGNAENCEHLRVGLEEYFYNAKVNVFTDMLGTARALLMDQTGIAAIIGTGTNSCLYNGHSITQNAVSLGFILGDEGSGAYIGKLFVKHYLEHKFDQELTEKILIETGATHSSVLSATYKNPHPNRYLASFCVFIKNNIQHQQLQEIIRFSFAKFFEKYVLIYPNYQNCTIGFCGSVAFNFQDFIVEIGNYYKIKNVSFINEPLSKIIEFHKLDNFN